LDQKPANPSVIKGLRLELLSTKTVLSFPALDCCKNLWGRK